MEADNATDPRKGSNVATASKPHQVAAECGPSSNDAQVMQDQKLDDPPQMPRIEQGRSTLQSNDTQQLRHSANTDNGISGMKAASNWTAHVPQSAFQSNQFAHKTQLHATEFAHSSPMQSQQHNAPCRDPQFAHNPRIDHIEANRRHDHRQMDSRSNEHEANRRYDHPQGFHNDRDSYHRKGYSDGRNNAAEERFGNPPKDDRNVGRSMHLDQQLPDEPQIPDHLAKFAIKVWSKESYEAMKERFSEFGRRECLLRVMGREAIAAMDKDQHTVDFFSMEGLRYNPRCGYQALMDPHKGQKYLVPVHNAMDHCAEVFQIADFPQHGFFLARPAYVDLSHLHDMNNKRDTRNVIKVHLNDCKAGAISVMHTVRCNQRHDGRCDFVNALDVYNETRLRGILLFERKQGRTDKKGNHYEAHWSLGLYCWTLDPARELKHSMTFKRFCWRDGYDR